MSSAFPIPMDSSAAAAVSGLELPFSNVDRRDKLQTLEKTHEVALKGLQQLRDQLLNSAIRKYWQRVLASCPNDCNDEFRGHV